MQTAPPPTRAGGTSKSDQLGVDTSAFDAASVRLIKKVALDTKTHPENATFRKLKLSNPKVALVWSNPSLQNALLRAGWVLHSDVGAEGELHLPATVDSGLLWDLVCGEQRAMCSGSWLIDHTPAGTDAASPESDSSSSSGDGGGSGASVAATHALLYDGRATEAALSTKYPARFRTPNKATIQQRFYGHGTTWLDEDRIGAVREPNVVQLCRDCGGCGGIVG
jgi:hypothetical protein